MSPGLVHPVWCASSNRCTAVHPRGGHLSAPWVFPAAGGRVATVVSLAQRETDRAPLVEIRLRIRLGSVDEAAQVRQVHRLLIRLNTAVREAIR